MDQERLDALKETWETMKNAITDTFERVWEFIKKWAKIITRAWVEHLSKKGTDEQQKHARIYLRTKNKRIERKHFKWLVATFSR